MPVEELVRDFPLAVPFEQGKYVRGSGITASQPAGPALHFKMNYGNALDDLDACEPWIDVRRRTIGGDPVKYVLYRPTVFDTLTVT